MRVRLSQTMNDTQSWLAPGYNLTVPSQTDSVTKITMIVAYGIIFPAALLGNSLVIYLVLKQPSMRSLTNLLLVNMCLANLLVTLLAMPYSVSFLFFQYDWISGVWGNVTCKLTHFSYALPIAASIFALILISMDRYYAVLHPFVRRPFPLRSTKLSFLATWVCSCVCMSPYWFQFRVVRSPGGTSRCIVSWSPFETVTASKAYFLFIFVFLYSLPLLGIGLAYLLIARKLWQRRIPGQQTLSNRKAAARSKRKVVRMLVVVVVVFALCWMPAHVMHFLAYYHKAGYFSLHPLVRLMAFWLCHANSAISPLLFLVMHHNFRQGILRLLKGSSLQCSPQLSSITHCSRGHNLMREVIPLVNRNCSRV